MNQAVKTIIDAFQAFGAIDHSLGINWARAHFAIEESASGFNKWCEANGYETGGVHPPNLTRPEWSVRYRR